MSGQAVNGLPAMRYETSYLQAAPWLDSVVFDSVRKGFGGRLRFVVSGGAPLAGRVQEYLQIALCCPVLQGYGLTETCVSQLFGTC